MLTDISQESHRNQRNQQFLRPTGRAAWISETGRNNTGISQECYSFSPSRHPGFWHFLRPPTPGRLELRNRIYSEGYPAPRNQQNVTVSHPARALGPLFTLDLLLSLRPGAILSLDLLLSLRAEGHSKAWEPSTRAGGGRRGTGEEGAIYRSEYIG